MCRGAQSGPGHVERIRTARRDSRASPLVETGRATGVSGAALLFPGMLDPTGHAELLLQIRAVNIVQSQYIDWIEKHDGPSLNVLN